MKQYNIKFLRFLILHYIFVFIVFTTYAENFLEPQLSKYQENFVINVFLNITSDVDVVVFVNLVCERCKLLIYYSIRILEVVREQLTEKL